MLVVRLNDLLEENHTNISELSEKTGISRTALTQLANNESKMVRFSTLDKIADFFNLESSSELFIDVSAGNIRFTPFKSKNDSSFECECKISTTSIRDKDPIVETFNIHFQLNKFNNNLWQINGELPNHIKNNQNILKILNRISPRSIDLKIDYFFDLLWSSKSVVGTFSDIEISGIFSDNILKEYISNPKKTIFSISDIESFDRIVNFYSYEFNSRLNKIDIYYDISNSGPRSELESKSDDLFFSVVPYGLQ